MKIFVVHSNCDNKKVKKHLNKIADAGLQYEILFLENDRETEWKEDALKKIEEANCALFFVGEESCESPNIDWELGRFIEQKKPVYTVLLQKDNKYNDILYREISFGNKEFIHDKKQLLYSESISLKKLVNELPEKLKENVADSLFDPAQEYSTATLLEQYKTYLQTSEMLVTRRHSVSNFYVTVNSTLISLFTALVALVNVFGNASFEIATIIGSFVVSILGSALCFNWRRIIISFGRLNYAKMEVIQSIESKLPCQIYKAEWKMQSAKLGKKKYVSFTNIEKTIPMIFLGIYMLVFCAGIVLSILYSVR